MANYSTNEFKNGLKVMVDNDPCSMTDVDMVKPGKGQAFTRVKMRNLITGRSLERTYKSGESLPGADVMDTDMQYLYNDSEFWYFMHPETFEQVAADAAAVGDQHKWLKEQDMCEVTTWNERPISIATPNFVELKITETDPGLKGDTAQGGIKPATLETGAMVRVPLFIEIDEMIKVDTRTGEYVGRVKS